MATLCEYHAVHQELSQRRKTPDELNFSGKNHVSKECSTKDKGAKCFKCNQYGHIVTRCTIGVLEEERIGLNKNNGKSIADPCADIEDMDGVNTDKLFEAMEVEFEDIMDQESSNEKVQSNDTECLIGLSDDNTEHAEKFVQPSEIYALNGRT
ncbi:hypothetical protein ALC56_03895 [Trachymyrmex septentrionalis]|uniref:CCHC-type domain-containing protein n=1 Tax=Trachymyrmex septentrionalis TaxID=34720 RepID=A0A151JZD4_9HYME|nr:hypothetical protein ALC56_03895 [Trachymyrmex septentrionalis]